ncbi:MAG: hypothetical protein NTY38_24500 [Acidobacteria bacterium]|nr:hypothetical protein [Acidobacteriota bacterium]
MPNLTTFAIILLGAVPCFSQSVLDRNLVVNGDAEAGAAISDQEAPPVKDVPGWTLEGNLTVAPYGKNNLLSLTDYGPGDRGRNYFIGGASGAKALATQSIDLAGSAAEIDAGRVRFYLGGYLGGGVWDESGTIRAKFFDGKGALVLTAMLKGPTGTEMNRPGALLARGTSGFLLPNTRKVEIAVDLSSTSSAYNLSGSDNISLELKLEPIIGTNLVVNGGGESISVKAEPDYPLPGWNGSSEIFPATYEWADVGAKDPGPEDRGQNLIAGYGINNLEVMQVVDVTLARDLVDAGGVRYNLSAWLGGYEDTVDEASVRVAFLNANGDKLVSAQTAPVTKEDRGAATGLFQRTLSGPVPAGARQVRITLELDHLGDATGNMGAYADSISLVLVSAAGPVTILDNGIINSASGQTGAVAPGEMITILTSGVNLASASRMQLDATGKVASELAGVKVFFSGTQAPILTVNSSQIGTIVPFNTDGVTSVPVRVEYLGVKSNTVDQPVAAAAPGVFTQEGTPKGAGLIYNEGWVLNSAANAAVKGSTVTIIWTGAGQTAPAGVDGRIEMQTLPRPKQNVTVKIDGQTADPVYVGAVPYSWAGLLMAQVKVPSSASTGKAVPVVISVGVISSPDYATLVVK